MDISGRHEEAGEYLMVGAAIAASVGTTRIQQVTGVGYAMSREEPTLENAVSLVEAAVADLPEPPTGPVVAERGEFYEEPAWSVGSSFASGFKYVESIGEREAVRIAHHAAYAARKLLL